MKKLIALLLAFVMVFSLVACVQDTPHNDDDDEEESMEETEEEEKYPVTYQFDLFGRGNSLKLKDEEAFVMSVVAEEMDDAGRENMGLEDLSVEARVLYRYSGRYTLEENTLTLKVKKVYYAIEVMGDDRKEAIERMIAYYEGQEIPYDEFAEDLFSSEGADMTDYLGEDQQEFVVEIEDDRMTRLVICDTDDMPDTEYQFRKDGTVEKQISYSQGEPHYYWTYDENGDVVESGSMEQEEQKPEDDPGDVPGDVPGDDPGDDPGDEPGGEIQQYVYDIAVWVPEAIVYQVVDQINAFNNNNDYGIRFNASVMGVAEHDAANHMLVDVVSGADLYCFSQDQTERLIAANALSALDSSAGNLVYSTMSYGAIRAVERNDRLWAYPMSLDNGYYMYYDSSIITDPDNLEAIIADCEAAGRNIAFELENAWYMASFFFATGCVSNWQMDVNGDFIGVEDTFNSDAGLIAARAMQKLINSGAYRNASYFTDYTDAVVITGIWNHDHALSMLGENLGVADLPSFTVDGQTYHLGSFSGGRYLGVKPQADADKEAALHVLAQYLTGEVCQQERLEACGWLPANEALQQSDLVQAHPGYAALLEQNQYAVPQGQIHGSWWDIAKLIAGDLTYGNDPETALANYQYAMDQFFVKEDSWSVIGSVGGTNWDYDFPMEKLHDGNWVTTYPIEMEAGAEFKIRLNGSWDINYGQYGMLNGDNFYITVAGTYYVVFDPYSGQVWLNQVG